MKEAAKRGGLFILRLTIEATHCSWGVRNDNRQLCIALQENDMNPMLIPLMIYQRWLELFFPQPKSKPTPYEG
jgi:hypothetical protein